jgi:predicted MPP superfamily phosphohydrolase
MAHVRSFAFKARLIVVCGHLYVRWSLLPDLPVDPAVRVLGGVLLVVSAGLVTSRNLFRHFIRRQEMVDVFIWAASLMMGWFSSLFIATLARDAVLLVPYAEAWVAESTIVVLVLPTGDTFIGFFNARRLAGVVQVDIPLAGLSPALNGFTIVQISDIHIGPTIKADFVRAIVDQVNKLNPDLIAITGDLVDGSVEHLANEASPLAGLRARHGAYVVSGNHEYYSGIDEWMAEFRDLGLRTLMNEHVVIEHNGAGLVIAGVNDFSANQIDPTTGSDPKAALSGSPKDFPKILLAHQPRTAPIAAELGYDLQLSGHTHGGQFWPWNYFVRMQQPYTAGLHCLGDLWVYTSRGTGYWGPPKRFGAPSEMTQITLSAVA